jgi:chromate transporter
MATFFCILPWSMRMSSLGLLFGRFLKLGATAYGGPAIAQHLKNAAVKEYGWLPEAEFRKGLALCQMTPGATFVMLSTYIGYRLRGIWGALVSVVAFVIPAFLLLLILSALYFKLGDLWYIQSLFKGLGAIVVAIVLNALLNFGKPILKDWKAALIAVLSFIAFLWRWNAVLVFLLAGIAALILRPAEEKSAAVAPQSSSPPSGAGRNYLILGLLAAGVASLFAIAYWRDPVLFQLVLTLSKVGILSFGGGFTSISLIQYEVVDKFQWVSTKEFLDGIAMGQITPGPIMITATFLGYKLAGLWGATLTTIAIFSPPFFLISLLIPQYDRIQGQKVIRIMEKGILAAFIGMLGLVLYNFGKTTFVDVPSIIFSAGAFLALIKKVDLSYVLLAGAVLSILVFGFIV